MKYQEYLQVKKYLMRFDEILNQMSNKMLNPDITDSITNNFIVCMIPHHMAAIYMCKNLLQYTQFVPLENIAKGIIKMQEAGIKQMQEIENTASRI